jgi:signal transduction histidine kinase
MEISELKNIGLLDGLTDDQLVQLIAGSDEVRIVPGAELFHEGDLADFWWLLVDGSIELVRRIGREVTRVGKMDVPGRWAGGFRAWDEQGVYFATGIGASEGRVLRVPAHVLRDCFNAWFPLGGHLVEGLYRTGRIIESTVRQRESLITLGTLSAGLAHELNNPAAATTRAVDSLEDACQTLLGSLSRLAREEISARQFVELDNLRKQIGPRPLVHDPLAAADAEQALSAWLIAHGVDREWSIASAFAAAGVDVAWCEKAAQILAGPALDSGLDWVASTLSAESLLAEIKDSSRRISELVGAMRSYSQMDRASLQRTDITQGLESTLVMLGHKLHGVTVVRDYGPDVPEIEAFPGELNQVWTNLIDNAIDAMDSEGTLRLTTRVDGNHVLVDVSDTGEGMPPEVAARAFDAFYTTKEVGKGSGLGLDIAQRVVVERHHGTITINSEPGRTVLRVRLPVTAS